MVLAGDDVDDRRLDLHVELPHAEGGVRDASSPRCTRWAACALKVGLDVHRRPDAADVHGRRQTEADARVTRRGLRLQAVAADGAAALDDRVARDHAVPESSASSPA